MVGTREEAEAAAAMLRDEHAEELAREGKNAEVVVVPAGAGEAGDEHEVTVLSVGIIRNGNMQDEDEDDQEAQGQEQVVEDEDRVLTPGQKKKQRQKANRAL